MVMSKIALLYSEEQGEVLRFCISMRIYSSLELYIGGKAISHIPAGITAVGVRRNESFP